MKIIAGFELRLCLQHRGAYSASDMISFLHFP
jgi:hypothetical protein